MMADLRVRRVKPRFQPLPSDQFFRFQLSELLILPETASRRSAWTRRPCRSKCDHKSRSGEKNADKADQCALHARRQAAIPRGLGHATAVYAERAENAELWDVEGKRYVDFAGGIAVLNTGHRHPKVIEAVKRQLDLYTHTCVQVVPYEPYIELAEKLNALAPFKGPAKTIFFTTGAEAAENAVKIARAATKRAGVIAFTAAFMAAP